MVLFKIHRCFHFRIPGNLIGHMLDHLSVENDGQNSISEAIIIKNLPETWGYDRSETEIP